MRTSFILKPICAVALLFASASPATQFTPLSIEQLRSTADIIVQGTVQSKTCARDAGGRICTRVELTVSETWKGQVVTNLTIVQSGGILGDEAAMVPGQANYDLGEEVVAFLVLNPRGEAVTLGLAHGKFHVWKHPKTREKVARNIFHGGGASPTPGQLNANSNAPLTLVELKRRALERKP